MKATATVISHTVRATAYAQPSGIRVSASEDSRRDLYKPLRVTPEVPQTLQWLTPGMPVTYQIVTNLDWIIE